MDDYISKKQTIDRIASCYCMDCEHSNGILCRACEHQDDMDLIDDMPTADVQPVKHGRWIEETPKHSRCSCCDVTCLIAVYPISANANFCPNCGARMDGGAE